MHGAFRFSIVLLAGFAIALPAATDAAQPKPPTPTQIRNAVTKAERSANLWATVDICDTKRHPRVIGIRGQMPSLGFAASHELNIVIDYMPTPKIGFKPSRVTASVALGESQNRLLQGGATWQFPRHTGRLRGTVTFVWRRGHQLLGRVTKRTTAGRHGVDFADPKGFSASECNIP